jgi:tagatose-6-phosphate ketose/aldose isomerase
MNQFLNLSTDNLKDQNADWTAREISQQPKCWKQVYSSVAENKALEQWLTPILGITGLRIIFAGAGTSAYIGDSLAPYLTSVKGRLFESISTTDMVSCPTQYLLKMTPSLVISFGRSGDSPESVAAVNLANEVIDECYHLIITCNPKGSLAKYSEQEDNAFGILMPEDTLDQSFAMTSSFSSMYVTTLCIFDRECNQINEVSEIVEHILAKQCDEILAVASRPNKKQIFLGSGVLNGIAKEASLKYLELTAGRIGCSSETSLGFRHGPKSNVDKDTIVVVLSSNSPYTGGYDRDIITEIKANDIAMEVISLKDVFPQSASQLSDAWLGLSYIVYCQILAFYKSLSLHLTPDNPCPTGEVNRVVKGVTIYPLSN